jgi:hypothetical protein
MIGNFPGVPSRLGNPTKEMEGGNEALLSQEETLRMSSENWLDSESKITTDPRFAFPYRLEHVSIPYWKIVSNFHHHSKSSGHQFVPFWSANKTLLHAIRLQVINGK